MASSIYVNGVALPSPVRGLEVIVSTAVDDGRNSQGELIGEKVGRDQYKINNLEWKGLTRIEWTYIGLRIHVQVSRPCIRGLGRSWYVLW